MKNLFKKVHYILLLMIIMICFMHITAFCREYNWVGDPQVSKWKVYDGDVQIKDKIICDDFNDSGIAYYYYIDKDGYMLTDTICPDYHIVDGYGRRLDKYGEVEKKVLFTKTEEEIIDEATSYLRQLALAEQDNSYSSSNSGEISVGTINKLKEETVNMFGPNLYVENVSQDGLSKMILGKGVVLKKEESDYDASINNELVNYIKDGNSYSKSANGTTYKKAKWNKIMALKGAGSYIDFDNPENNFNKVTGRIAMQNISSSAEKETIMQLIIYDDQGEEIYSTTDFNYNGGKKFSCTFLKKTKWLRFELEINGSSTTRYAMLRDLKYGFDRRAYEEEKEEDMDNELMNALSEENGDDEIDFDEVDEDGYTEEERIAMASESNASYNDEDDDEDDEEYSEDDEGDSNNGVSPDKKTANQENNTDDNISGPNFDEKLKGEAEKQSKTGPAFIVQ